MKLFQNFKKWWMVKTGKDDTPFDGETPYWVISLLLHVGLLLVLASIFIEQQRSQRVSVIVPPLDDTAFVDAPMLDVEYKDESDIGSNDNDNFQAVLQMAPTVDELIDVDLDVDQEIRDLGDIQMSEFIPDEQSAMDVNSIAVRGIAGEAMTGTSGAIDRITHEILLSLEERKTLVVWMFDQSASLLKQRDEVVNRFDRVYAQLSAIEQAGGREFKKHKDTPLLTQVFAFGSQFGPMMRKPTDDLEQIKLAVRNIETDTSGVENVFAAIAHVGLEFKNLSKVDRRTGDKERNVMIIVLSDECGDDIVNLDTAIDICKRFGMRVYVIGIPAPFGREFTYVKWVDPDPQYDQSVQWAPVRQGPESFLPERVKLHLTEIEQEEEVFDSGFGPFGLTRLCFQTGGIYFTVHPNRQDAGRIPRWKTSTYSAYLSRFFDPEVMRRYRPDYVSENEYRRQISSNPTRYALVSAAHLSRVRPLEPPQLRFEKLDEAQFANAVSRAQQAAAVLEPKLNLLYETLKKGELGRDREISPRWKAGFDLAMGRVLAAKIRAESYNAMLAQAKTKLKFKDEKNNTWILRPADQISTGSQAEKLAARAKSYLQRVVDEHADTPWGLLASRELQTPIGWQWTETFTQPPQPPPRRPPSNNNNNNNNIRRPNQNPPPVVQPKPRRSPPKL